MEKRKRRQGGGRKPGEFGKLGAVMSLRLPEDLRDQLKEAGRRNGRSMSAELIFRARASFEQGPSKEVAAFAHDLLRLAKEQQQKWRRK